MAQLEPHITKSIITQPSPLLLAYSLCISCNSYVLTRLYVLHISLLVTPLDQYIRLVSSRPSSRPILTWGCSAVAIETRSSQCQLDEPSDNDRPYFAMYEGLRKREEVASLLEGAEKIFNEADLHSHMSIFRSNIDSLIASPTQSLTLLLRRILIGLIPSFLRTDTRRQEKLYPTAYLDGLRGCAAFAVFLCHLTYGFYVVSVGYGMGNEGLYNDVARLPILRLIYAGPPMVAIFFVISGYALSCKPIKQMRARQYDGLLQTLSSSVFRRGFRLFLPCVVSTFIVLVAVRLGAFEVTRPFSENRALHRNVNEEHKYRLPHLSDQLWDWVHKLFDFVHVFHWMIYSGSIDYDRHLWTIPVEYRASLMLFLSHFATSRMKPALRMLTFAFLSYWAYLWTRWELPLFWFGAILAEWDLMRKPAHGPDLSATPKTPTRFWHAFWLTNFLIALYLCSFPDRDGIRTPGFSTIADMIPRWYPDKNRFWQSLGAMQLVWAIGQASYLQAMFNGPVIQYLGRISYALYLMHGLVIHTVGYFVLDVMWGITGYQTEWEYGLGFALGVCIIVPVAVWGCGCFLNEWWMCPCVKFAKWLEAKCTV